MRTHAVGVLPACPPSLPGKARNLAGVLGGWAGPWLLSASPADGGLCSEAEPPTLAAPPRWWTRRFPAEKSDGCGRESQHIRARLDTFALSHLSRAGGGGRA